MTSEIVVVGAGVVGLSSARALAQRGAKVTLIDAATPGGQGSRAAAGVAIPSIRLLDDPAMLDFTSRGKEVLGEDLEALSTAFSQGGLRRGSGILRPAADAAARAAMEQKAQGRESWLGRWLPRAEVEALEPALAGAPILGAFLQDDGSAVDVESYLNALLHDVRRRAVAVRLGEPVLEIQEDPQGVAVRTVHGTMRADRVVVAAGAWSGGLTGLRPLPVRPQRGQILTLFSPQLRLTRIVSGPTYLAPWRAGEIVVGATEEDAGYHPHPTTAGLLYLLAAAARLAPLLREARFMTAWAGLRSVGPSSRPLIGPYPGTARVLIATGHAGQGILTGGLTGRLVADLCEGQTPELIAPFAPGAPA